MIILKYPLELQPENEVIVPMGSKILCFQNQREVPTIWVMADETVPQRVSLKFKLIGTGQPFDSKYLLYIGTVQIGSFVWHLFQK